MRLKDKVAIITGAARGIGAAFAVGFAKEGAKIVICSDILGGKETVEAVEKAGSQAIFVRTDVRKQDQCDALARAAMDRFGAVDILVNNAAVLVTLKPFTEVTTEEWMHVMEVNTAGPFHCTKAVFPYMKEKGGKIINMSSAVIFEGVPGDAPLRLLERGDCGLYPFYGPGVGCLQHQCQHDRSGVYPFCRRG